MSKKDLRSLDALVSSSNELLGNLAPVEQLVGELPEQTVADIHSKIRRRAMESVDISPSTAVDARVELNVAGNGMSCTATLYPAVGGGAELEMQTIESLLIDNNIIYGIAYDTLQDAVFRCNTQGIRVRDVLVAAGKEPVPALSEHVLIEKRLLEPPTPADLDAQRVEHKERSPFIFVAKGDPLAHRFPKRDGTSGWDIFGGELSSPMRQMPVIEAGENTAESDGVICAEIDGRFVFSGRSFSVNPVLDIPGDVDYSTGHIDFSGDVLVGGEIKEGFNVKATGTLFCAKTVSATDIECGKDLVIVRGIIGRQKGSVKVGGEVRCKYIEHCYVEAGGPIRTVVGAMNSVINTLSTFETGPRGILVGGKIYAQNGVVVGQVGTEMGPATEIYCGIDYSVLNRLEWIRDRNMELANKLMEVRSALQSQSDKDGSLKQLEAKLHEAITKMNEASVTLVSHLDKNEEATVAVREEIHPNSYIEICHASYVVTRVMRKVCFRLDREKGKVVAGAIS